MSKLEGILRPVLGSKSHEPWRSAGSSQPHAAHCCLICAGDSSTLRGSWAQPGAPGDPWQGWWFSQGVDGVASRESHEAFLSPGQLSLVSELLEGPGRLMLVLYGHPEGIGPHRWEAQGDRETPLLRIFWETPDRRRGGRRHPENTSSKSHAGGAALVLLVQDTWGLRAALGTLNLHVAVPTPCTRQTATSWRSHRDFTRGFFSSESLCFNSF